METPEKTTLKQEAREQLKFLNPAQRVRAVRSTMEMKQRELADLLNTGLSTVQYWEHGNAEPGGMNQEKINLLIILLSLAHKASELRFAIRYFISRDSLEEIYPRLPEALRKRLDEILRADPSTETLNTHPLHNTTNAKKIIEGAFTETARPAPKEMILMRAEDYKTILDLLKHAVTSLTSKLQQETTQPKGISARVGSALRVLLTGKS